MLARCFRNYFDVRSYLKKTNDLKISKEVTGKEQCVMVKDFLLNSVAGSRIVSQKVRKKIYTLYGNEISKNCSISPACFLGYGKGKLHVGEGVFINYNCFFDFFGETVRKLR